MQNLTALRRSFVASGQRIEPDQDADPRLTFPPALPAALDTIWIEESLRNGFHEDQSLHVVPGGETPARRLSRSLSDGFRPALSALEHLLRVYANHARMNPTPAAPPDRTPSGRKNVIVSSSALLLCKKRAPLLINSS